MHGVKVNRSHAFAAFAAYLLFVVYGSLMPFEPRNLSLTDAISGFQQIRFLDLGIVSRADWIANILLYIPLAFLGCTWAAGLRALSAVRLLAVLLVTVVCLALAVSIEFTQQFFAPRTVSINDLIAETTGTGLGVLLWVFGRDRVTGLWRAFQQGGRQSMLAAIVSYTFLYLVLSLFPYDFVISVGEFKGKLASGNLGWLIAGQCTSPLRCIAVQFAEVVAIAPLGFLLALVSPTLSFRRLFVAGLLLGLVLEIVQLPLASGVSQGLSLLLRGTGLVVGAGLARAVQRLGVDRIAQLTWKLSLFLALPYLLAVAALNGWFASGWLSLGEGLTRLGEINLLPFYYHYFTTETMAVASLLAQIAMYMPVGLAVWAMYARRPYRGRGMYVSASLIVVSIAFSVELGKSMVPTAHPDFTNLLIAASGAVMTCWLAQWLERVLRGDLESPACDSPSIEISSSDTFARAVPLHPIGTLLAVVFSAAAIAGMVGYPVAAALLVLIVAVYATLLIKWPWLWLFALAALLPVFDMSQVTGKLLLDEFDLLVLTALAVGYWQLYALPARDWPNKLFSWAYILLWLTWAVAMARGLWPLAGYPDDVLASSHSPHEAWVTGKGMLWALLLVPLLRRVPAAKAETARSFLINGLVAGLALLCIVVLWERHVFVGIGDFRNVFRVTGSFSSMHTGGAYIEAYIAFVFPVSVIWILRQRHWWGRLAGIALAAATTYAMMVTFSRGGYAGLVAGFILLGLAVWRWQVVTLRHRALLMAAVLLAVVVVAIPVLTGDFAKHRLERAADDFHIRLAHWERALGLMDDGALTAMAGMGFGRYPAQYLYYADVERSPGNYSVLRENNETFVRLGAGEPVYLDQMVSLEPESAYQVSANLRGTNGRGQLKVALCEKALLTSFDCQWIALVPEEGDIGSQWHEVTVGFNPGSLGRGGNWPHRPVKLSLFNPDSANPIDVAAVSLKSAGGLELLANGDFKSGMARWLFVTDQDLAWHIHQQQLEMYFAQGWLGLLALAILLVAMIRCMWPAVRSGDAFATALAGGLLAFLVVGLLGSTVDTARLALLFYFGALSGGLLTASPASRH